jgi:hypothetical protein
MLLLLLRTAPQDRLAIQAWHLASVEPQPQVAEVAVESRVDLVAVHVVVLLQEVEIRHLYRHHKEIVAEPVPVATTKITGLAAAVVVPVHQAVVPQVHLLLQGWATTPHQEPSPVVLVEPDFLIPSLVRRFVMQLAEVVELQSRAQTVARAESAVP